MTKFMLVCAALAAIFVAGDSLICDTCRVSFRGKCLFGYHEICRESESNCFWGELTFNRSRMIGWESRGCLASELCNQTETGTLLKVGYTVTRECCSTDFCNGAASIQLPLTAALGAALVAVWSTWGL